jgi:hypothetical protein
VALDRTKEGAARRDPFRPDARREYLRVNFLPDELAEVSRVALLWGCSRGALIREAIRRSLPALAAEARRRRTT